VVLSDSPRHGGVNKAYIRKTMEFFQRMTDSQLYAWLAEGQGETTEHTTECFASLDFAGFPKRGEIPGDASLRADMKRRLHRLESFLLGKPMPKESITRLPNVSRISE
jgi:hypothetical protein